MYRATLAALLLLLLLVLVACERRGSATAAGSSTGHAAPAPRALPARARGPSEVGPPPAVPSPPAAPSSTDPVAAGLRYVERVTGGASPADRLPLVVAVHGLGDTPESYLELFASFPARARVVAPRGLDAFGGGWSWFPPGSADQLAPAFARARDALAAAIPAMAAARATCGLPIVTGFSQGGMLAFAVLALERSIVRAALPLAGRLPRSFWPAERPLGGLLPELVAFHGESDDRIPLAAGRATVAAFQAVGFSATLHTYPGLGHAVSPALYRDFERELARLVAAGSCP